jgi:hypothetical protein
MELAALDQILLAISANSIRNILEFPSIAIHLSTSTSFSMSEHNYWLLLLSQNLSLTTNWQKDVLLEFLQQFVSAISFQLPAMNISTLESHILIIFHFLPYVAEWKPCMANDDSDMEDAMTDSVNLSILLSQNNINHISKFLIDSTVLKTLVLIICYHYPHLKSNILNSILFQQSSNVTKLLMIQSKQSMIWNHSLSGNILNIVDWPCLLFTSICLNHSLAVLSDDELFQENELMTIQEAVKLTSILKVKTYLIYQNVKIHVHRKYLFS